ncbi:MAG TPA: hypothetical protein VJU59_38315 [Paraburkholderia sp.]|uniref:hypothetical protein n=1 Tax=Paraburkholderia sp. TaxID=1926495 RepID=UPI002B47D034|nr:hypothetical protein [Paraburkholderia sp.]HKR45464.1 hypothetical protein [Paraburkholderia sp.]
MGNAMKFCKDCKHYRAGLATHGGSLLPGLFIVVPDGCYGARTPEINLVTGVSNTYAGDCKAMRADGADCGPQGKWFEPANLDGRLAMLEKD